MRLVLLFVVLVTSLSGHSSSIKKEEMLQFIDQTVLLFETAYAPANWKKERYGWDVQKEAERIKAKILADRPISIKEFQGLFLEFIYTAHDYHVGATFYSTELAYLPFTVKKIGSKYLITSVNEEELSSQMQVGDELVLFDGQDPDVVVSELKRRYTPSGNEKTDQAKGEILLAYRTGRLGMIVPQGQVDLCVKNQEGELYTVQLMWKYKPEKIQDLFAESLPKEKNRNRQTLFVCADPNATNSITSIIPHLGEPVWEDNTGYVTGYIYQLSDHLIGFIRIPHYVFEQEDFVKIEELIDKLERETDALVIDQRGNSGGIAMHCYEILSLLTDRPLPTPKHYVVLNQKKVSYALQMLDYLDECDTPTGQCTAAGLTLSSQEVINLREYFQSMIGCWNAGKLMTDPIHIESVVTVNSNRNGVHYTKPILMLINELNFSAADFVPTILKNSERATLLGQRTAGAGGAVETYYLPNRLGIEAVYLTKTFAITEKNLPIEDLGVEPDVLYELTEEDIRTQYQPFKQEINRVVEKLLEENNSFSYPPAESR